MEYFQQKTNQILGIHYSIKHLKHNNINHISISLINFNQFKIVFIFFLGGVCLAFFTFIGEILLDYYLFKKKKKINGNIKIVMCHKYRN